jgi:hypothetical protein
LAIRQALKTGIDIMKQLFPKTLAAAKAGESSLWAIGDALIAECGPPGEVGAHNGSNEKIAEAAVFLAEQGIEYSEHTLRQLRQVAFAFPHDARASRVSWHAHLEAGTPKTLNAAIKSLPKGQKLTANYVREFRQAVANKAFAKAERGKAKEPYKPTAEDLEVPQPMTRTADKRDRLVCYGKLWVEANPDPTAEPLYADVDDLTAKIAVEMDRQKPLSTDEHAKQQRVEKVLNLMNALNVTLADLETAFAKPKPRLVKTA